MKTCSLIVALIALIASAFAASATTDHVLPVAKDAGTILLPKTMRFYHYPHHLGGRRGQMIEVEDIVQDGAVVSAKMTMHGRGRDGCTLRGHPSKGTIEDMHLVLRSQVAQYDNLTCDMELNITVTAAGGCVGGTFKRFPDGAGDLKCD